MGYDNDPLGLLGGKQAVVDPLGLLKQDNGTQSLKLSDFTAQPQKVNTNINFNQLNAQHGKLAPTAEQNNAVAYGAEVGKEKIAKRDEAIDNSLKLKYQQQGKTVSKNSSQYRKDFSDIASKIGSGDMVQTTARDGKPFIVNSKGFLPSVGDALINSFKSPVEGFKIMNLDGKELADYLDKKNEETPYLQEQPSPFLGQFGEAIGGLPKIAGEFSINEAVPQLGTAIATADAELGASGQKTQELYQKNLKELTDKGMPLAEARVEAANKAKKDAPIAAAPDALMTAALGEMGADTKGLSDAATTFKQTLVKSGKSVGKFGALGGAAGAATTGIEKAQGYKVTMQDALDNFGNEGFQYATMDAMFKLAPLVSKMLTPQKASWLNYMSKVPEQVRNENLPKEINQEINDYSKASETVPDHYSDEQKVALSHLIQKKNELKENTDDNFKEDKEQQIQNIDKTIKAVKQNPDNPLDFIPDENTGEHNLNPKEWDKLNKGQKEGIINQVDKKYGEVEIKEVGADENKKFVPQLKIVKPDGSIETVKLEDGKQFSDKTKAKDAGELALAQHYYENGMQDFEKPQSKKQNEEVIQPEGVEGNKPNNEHLPADESGKKQENVGETSQPKEEPIKEETNKVLSTKDLNEHVSNLEKQKLDLEKEKTKQLKRTVNIFDKYGNKTGTEDIPLSEEEAAPHKENINNQINDLNNQIKENKDLVENKQRVKNKFLKDMNLNLMKEDIDRINDVVGKQKRNGVEVEVTALRKQRMIKAELKNLRELVKNCL